MYVEKFSPSCPAGPRRAWRVYLGGSRIRALHGNPGTQDDHFPEEWIASTVEAAGAGAQPEAGLSHLQDQPSLISLRPLPAVATTASPLD